MAQFNAKAFALFLFFAALLGLGECWSTVVVETCVTKSQKNPGKTPKTVTVTKTKYIEQISTETVTPTDVVALSTTTTTLSLTATVIDYTGTTTVTTDTTYSGYAYTYETLNYTTTDVVTVALGVTTTTASVPKKFTPASSNPTTTAAPPIRVAVGFAVDGVAVTATPDIGRVSCVLKYILSTTVTTTVTAAVVTETETTAVATSYVSDITSTTTSAASSVLYYSYTPLYTSTSTYTLTHHFVETTTTTIAVPTATAYPGCAANNLVSVIGNYSIGGYVANETPQELNATDAYSCCVSCMQADSCTGSIFYEQGETDYYDYYTANCWLFTVEIGKKCRPAKKDGWGYYLDYYTSYYNDTWTVSNGPCGQGYLTSEY